MKYQIKYKFDIGNNQFLIIKEHVEKGTFLFYTLENVKETINKPARIKPELAKELIINRLDKTAINFASNNNELSNRAEILKSYFNCSLEDYGGQGWDFSSSNGKFELRIGYGSEERIENYTSKKEVKKKYNQLDTQAAVWDLTRIPELVTAKTY